MPGEATTTGPRHDHNIHSTRHHGNTSAVHIYVTCTQVICQWEQVILGRPIHKYISCSRAPPCSQHNSTVDAERSQHVFNAAIASVVMNPFIRDCIYSTIIEKAASGARPLRWECPIPSLMFITPKMPEESPVI